jgi:hypothetical protein
MIQCFIISFAAGAHRLDRYRGLKLGVDYAEALFGSDPRWGRRTARDRVIGGVPW